MKLKLKSCSCGHEAKLVFSTDDTDGILHYQWYAVCTGCHNHTTGYETKKEAIKAWNQKERV